MLLLAPRGSESMLVRWRSGGQLTVLPFAEWIDQMQARRDAGEFDDSDAADPPFEPTSSLGTKPLAEPAAPAGTPRPVEWREPEAVDHFEQPALFA